MVGSRVGINCRASVSASRGCVPPERGGVILRTTNHSGRIAFTGICHLVISERVPGESSAGII